MDMFFYILFTQPFTNKIIKPFILSNYFRYPRISLNCTTTKKLMVCRHHSIPGVSDNCKFKILKTLLWRYPLVPNIGHMPHTFHMKKIFTNTFSCRLGYMNKNYFFRRETLRQTRSSIMNSLLLHARQKRIQT